MTMEGGRQLDRWDGLLIFAILSAILVFLRLNKSVVEPPALQPTFGSSGMDAVWRDAVKPMDVEDLRPLADPDLSWEEAAPAAKEVPVETPAPQAAPEPERRPEPEERVEKYIEPPFEKPRLTPFAHTLTGSGGSSRSKASYRPPQAQAPSAAPAPPAPRAPSRAAPASAAKSAPAPARQRSWRAAP